MINDSGNSRFPIGVNYSKRCFIISCTTIRNDYDTISVGDDCIEEEDVLHNLLTTATSARGNLVDML